jgi:hypothetical protein
MTMHWRHSSGKTTALAKRKWALSGKTEVGVQLAKRKWALSGVTGAALVGVRVLVATSGHQPIRQEAAVIGTRSQWLSLRLRQ